MRPAGVTPSTRARRSAPRGSTVAQFGDSESRNRGSPAASYRTRRGVWKIVFSVIGLMRTPQKTRPGPLRLSARGRDLRPLRRISGDRAAGFRIVLLEADAEQQGDPVHEREVRDRERSIEDGPVAETVRAQGLHVGHRGALGLGGSPPGPP